MQIELVERARLVLRQNNLQGALLSNPFNVAWLGQHFPSAIGGPDPFEGGPALLWLGLDEAVLLVAGGAKCVALKNNLLIRTYVGFTVTEPMNPAVNLEQALCELLQAHVPNDGTLGVEVHNIPTNLLEIMQEQHPRSDWKPIDGILDSFRAVKTKDEISKLRASLSLCDFAQQTMRSNAHVGMTEIELFALVENQIVQRAETQLPIVTNLIAGTRTAERGMSPSGYLLEQGDLVLFDIALRYAGYWGDNCSTISVGSSQRELKRMYNVVLDALHMAEEMIRPGVRASDVDRSTREFIRERGYEPYWHHTGHGIGVSYHEAPRLVPYNHEALQEGMVICLEPGIYLHGIGGIRLEDVVLVTQDGVELLSQWSIPFKEG